MKRELASSNPAVRNGVFTRVRAEAGESTMTIGGSLAKTGVLLLLVIGAALYTWSHAAARPDQLGFLVMTGVIGGLVLAMVTIFVPRLAPITSPFYAVLEGVALGGISWMYNARFAGLPQQAVLATFGVAIVMLLLYRSGAVRATPRFRRVITIAALGIFAVYMVNMIMGFFGAASMLAGGGPGVIAFTAVAALVAAFFLILDFDLVEQGVAAGAPKRMEWYAGFSILVTLIWLYLELLRLLSLLRGDD